MGIEFVCYCMEFFLSSESIWKASRKPCMKWSSLSLLTPNEVAQVLLGSLEKSRKLGNYFINLENNENKNNF